MCEHLEHLPPQSPPDFLAHRLPWMVLAASSDRCPLKVQGMRPRSTGQMWTCTPTGFISANSQAPVSVSHGGRREEDDRGYLRYRTHEA